jgi:hypothetical protein
MRSSIRLLMVLGLAMSGGACTPSYDGTSSCNLLSYYSDEAECKAKIGTGTCELFTVNSTDKPIVCWRKKTAGGTNTNTGGSTTGGGGVTPTPSVNPCLSAQTPWTIGAWTPTKCGPGVASQTRSVSCTASCPCNVPSAAKPVESQNCVPDLYGNSHYASECTAAGGTVEWIGTSRICSVPKRLVQTTPIPIVDSNCPSGWQALGGSPGYIITSPGTANEYYGSGKTRQVSTGSHSSYMAYREYLVYCSDWGFLGCKTWSTLYANIDKRACY